MAVIVQCPNPVCRQNNRIFEEHLGHTLHCAHCGRALTPDDAIAVTETSAPVRCDALAPLGAEPQPGGGAHDAVLLVPGAKPLADYELVQQLGRGGFGEVWKAVGPGGVAVALKCIPLGDRAGVVELRSLQFMKDVRHPHLLGLFGAWQRPGLLILALELADRTLHDRWHEATSQGAYGIPGSELLQYMREAAQGIDHLNGLGIQHRDIEPANLLLVGGGVKIADFGLAKLLEHTVNSNSGAMTPSYAAPEFFAGHTSSQSDQYALAVTYCELRGGRLPFEGNPAQVLAGQLLQPPDLTMLPEAERPVVARALAKQPADRWPSCGAFVEALAAHAAGSAPLPTAAPKSPVRGRGSLTQDHPPSPTASQREPIPAFAQVSDPPLLGSDWGLPHLLRQWWMPAVSSLVGLLLLALLIVLISWIGGPNSPPPNSIDMKLEPIPAGKFQMGSPKGEEGRDDNEAPLHEVEITQPFYMGKYAVTRGQFRLFIQDEKYHGGKQYKTDAEKDGAAFTWENPRFMQTDEHPVVYVSWNDAVAFCEWLSQKEGKKYRLPTEAEWEYSCRAGTTTRYGFGDVESQLKDYAWYDKNSDRGTHSVGKKKANARGLYDMHGNVRQWCQDWYDKDYYTNRARQDPQGPGAGTDRVARGSSWSSEPRNCRAARRMGHKPDGRDNDLGFRVVRVP
jgi:formylglycine-generating enzyme required for sulfatase activity